MPDLASLLVTITTDTGGSQEKLASLGAQADATATQLAGVEAAGASVGGGLAKVVPATAQAEAGFVSLGAATSTLDTSAATTAASIEQMIAPMTAASAAADTLAVSTATVSRESIVLPLHIAHLAESAERGAVSFRTLGSVARGFSEQIAGLASALDIGVTALVGITIAQGILDIAIIKNIKNTEELDKAITGMAQGVAAGTDLTTEAFNKEIEEATKAGGATKSVNEDVGKSYIQTGNIATEGLSQIINVTETWARLTGTTVPEATKEFTTAFSGTVGSYEKMQATLSFLTRAQQDEIDTLAKSGQASEAAQKIADALTEKFGKQTKQATGLSAVWKTLEETYHSAIDTISRLATTTANEDIAFARWVESTRAAEAVSTPFTVVIGALGTVLNKVGENFKIVATYGEAYKRAIESGATAAQASVAAQAALAKETSAAAAAEQQAISVTEKKIAEVTQSIAATKAQVSADTDWVKANDKVAASLGTATGAQTQWERAQKEGLVTTASEKAAMAANAVEVKNLTLATQTEATAAGAAAVAKGNEAQQTIALRTAEVALAEARATANGTLNQEVINTEAATAQVDKLIAAKKAMAEETARESSAEAQAAEDLDKETQKMKEHYDAEQKAAAASDTFDTQMAALDAAVKSYTTDMAAATTATDNFSSSAADAATKAGQFAGIVTGAGQGGTITVGGGAIPGVTPLGGGGGGPSPLTANTNAVNDLSSQISKLQGIQRPGAPPTPPTESAGATVATQPGAFGGDKNPSFFYDPASRQTFMSQFGIQGDEATRNAERSYQQALAAYNLQLQQYNLAQAQLAVLQRLAAQAAARPSSDSGGGMGGGMGIMEGYGWVHGLPFISTAFGRASGGDFVVNGYPGQDQNLISMRMSHGELISITPPGETPGGSPSAGAPVTINMNISTPDVAGFKQSRSTIVNRVAAAVGSAAGNRR